MGDEELKSSQPMTKLSPSSKTSGVGILQQIEEEDKLESLSWNERMKLKKREKAERLKAEKEASAALKESKRKEVKTKVAKQAEIPVPSEKSNSETSVVDLPNLSSSFKSTNRTTAVFPATFSGMANESVDTKEAVVQSDSQVEEKVVEPKVAEGPVFSFTIEEEKPVSSDVEKAVEVVPMQKMGEKPVIEHDEHPKPLASDGIISFSFEDDDFEDMTPSAVNTSAKGKESVSNKEATIAQTNIAPVVVSFSFEDDEPIAHEAIAERKFVPNVAFDDDRRSDKSESESSEHEVGHTEKVVSPQMMSEHIEPVTKSNNSNEDVVLSFEIEPEKDIERISQSKSEFILQPIEEESVSPEIKKSGKEKRKKATTDEMTNAVNKNNASAYSLDYEKAKAVSDSRPKERPIDRMHRRQNNAMLIKLIVQVAIILIFFTVIFRNTVVSSASMEPTLITGDFAVFNKLAYNHSEVCRGDIITFYSREYKENFSKRVIGIAGDTVEFHDGYVFINGLKADESAYLPVDMETNCNKSFIVPNNCVFVLGDNRTNSYDSRFFMNPYISCDDIVGKYIGSIHKMW